MKKLFECQPEEIKLLLRIRQLLKENSTRFVLLDIKNGTLSVVCQPEIVAQREKQEEFSF